MKIINIFFKNNSYLLLIFSVIFFSLLIYRLDLPGFYYDELLFVNAALNNDSSEMFLHKQFLGLS